MPDAVSFTLTGSGLSAARADKPRSQTLEIPAGPATTASGFRACTLECSLRVHDHFEAVEGSLSAVRVDLLRCRGWELWGRSQKAACGPSR